MTAIVYFTVDAGRFVVTVTLYLEKYVFTADTMVLRPVVLVYGKKIDAGALELRADQRRVIRRRVVAERRAVPDHRPAEVQIEDFRRRRRRLRDVGGRGDLRRQRGVVAELVELVADRDVVRSLVRDLRPLGRRRDVVFFTRTVAVDAVARFVDQRTFIRAIGGTRGEREEHDGSEQELAHDRALRNGRAGGDLADLRRRGIPFDPSFGSNAILRARP
jgi:hypothetical protein